MPWGRHTEAQENDTSKIEVAIYIYIWRLVFILNAECTRDYLLARKSSASLRASSAMPGISVSMQIHDINESIHE